MSWFATPKMILLRKRELVAVITLLVLQTVKTDECHIKRYFIRVWTVCLDLKKIRDRKTSFY